MPHIDPTAGGKAPVIPDDTYIVTCIDAKLITVEEDQYGKTDKLRLELAGATMDGEAFTVEPLMNNTWSAFPNKPPSTLFTYAKAFGCNPDPNEPFDTDELIGKRLQGLIATDSEPGSWPRIQSFVEYKSVAAQKGPPAASTTPTERIAGPAFISAQGDVDWKVYWAAIERYGGTREGIAAKVGGLDKLEQMSFDQLADLLEALRI